MSKPTTNTLDDSFPPPWNKIFRVATRLLVWGSLFGVLYILRSFSLLIFLTFVFAYLQDHGVDLLDRYPGPRWLRVTVVALVVLGILVAIGAYLVPRIIAQAEVYVDKYPDYIQEIDKTVLELSQEYTILAPLVPERALGTEDTSPSAELLKMFFGEADGQLHEKSLRRALELVRGIGGALVGIGSAFFLALLFSFLIVLDLPRLADGLKALKHSRVAWIYNELAGSVFTFAQTLGRALEAQLAIAIINTVLTAILIQFLGVGDKTAFLSLIVFLCSFIPVAGVFISSVPICLSVLPISGLSGVGLAILAIWIIHMIEGYILNPRIYGHHMRMNPVVVLIILTVGGKLFHIWGLVLGVPVCTYLFTHVIKGAEDQSGAKA